MAFLSEGRPRTILAMSSSPGYPRMLTIGVLGNVGSGKTALLQKLANWWQTQGRQVEGFLAIASVRAPGAAGAPRYDLEMLNGGKRFSYAVRDESLHPPYRFDETAASTLNLWADGLERGKAPSLMIIDEFGPVEADGGGHVSLWSRILGAKPEVLAVAVRKGLEGAIQTRLGTQFDVLIDVDSPGAWESLRQACVAHSDWMRIGLYGGGAGGFEASVGAILHGVRMPLRGLFMASTQSAIMTYAAHGLGHRRRVVWVAFIAASLKALSPTGDRLRPMLAITLQGLLFGGSITLAGWNIVGAAMGGFLIGVWSAIQGVALQYLFVGSDVIRAYDSAIQWIAKQLSVGSLGFLALVFGWSLVCGAVTSGLTVLAWKRREKMPARLHDAVFKTPKGVILDPKPASASGAMRRGVKDILRPLFWMPVLIVVGITIATGSPLESALWIIVRAAAVGFVLFSAVRAFDMHRFIQWLKHRGYWGPALAYERAVVRIRGEAGTSPKPKTGPGPSE